MTRDEMSLLMDRVFEECRALREAGQKEYAGGEDAFGNFNRLAARLGIDRKQVLLVYLAKHQDGVDSFIRGHKSQREDVRGRINDEIVYLCLLRGMIEEEAIGAHIEGGLHSFVPGIGKPSICAICGEWEENPVHGVQTR